MTSYVFGRPGAPFARRTTIRKENSGVYFPAVTTCDVLEVRHSGDDSGDYCGRDTTAQCSDCARHLCDRHAENCSQCAAVFCAGCLSYHLSDHALPPQVERLARIRKRA